MDGGSGGVGQTGLRPIVACDHRWGTARLLDTENRARYGAAATSVCGIAGSSSRGGRVGSRRHAEESFRGSWLWLGIAALALSGVAEATVTATGVTLTATEGTLLASVVVATFTTTDPGPLPASSYTATIDWGDGSATTVGTITGPVTGTYSVVGSHTYADEGTFTLTVHVDDAVDSTTATASGTANVGEGDFGTLLSATFNATVGVPYTGSVGSFTDPGNPLQVASDWSATIDWGDGTNTVGTVSGATGGPFTISRNPYLRNPWVVHREGDVHRRPAVRLVGNHHQYGRCRGPPADDRQGVRRDQHSTERFYEPELHGHQSERHGRAHRGRVQRHAPLRFDRLDAQRTHRVLRRRDDHRRPGRQRRQPLGSLAARRRLVHLLGQRDRRRPGDAEQHHQEASPPWRAARVRRHRPPSSSLRRFRRWVDSACRALHSCSGLPAR